MGTIRPGRIVKGFKRAILGENTTSSDLRLETCKICEHLKGGFCGLCGCLTSAKSKVKEEYCPDNRWFDIKVIEDQGIAVGILTPEKVESFDLSKGGKKFIVNFGEVKSGEDINLDFIVVNDRSSFFEKNLTLKDVKMRSSCGCAHVATEIPKDLEDGEYAPFSVKYDSEILGLIHQSVRLISGDDIIFKLLLTGKVI